MARATDFLAMIDLIGTYSRPFGGEIFYARYMEHGVRLSVPLDLTGDARTILAPKHIKDARGRAHKGPSPIERINRPPLIGGTF